jgi:ribosomal protein L11 methylase PrmA
MADARVEREPASYRDPSGFVYRRDGVLLRQVQPPFAEDWRAFNASGLYRHLADDRLLVAHEEADPALAATPGAVAVLRPEPISFLSFPYEWSFSQLKYAALLTLRAQEAALEHGMTLKDASAFNVQFIGARPILIDTLSFERYEEGAAWVGYRQFCEHFLGPLALIAHGDPRVALLLRDMPDGIPVELTSSLLRGRTRLNFGLLTHLHLHAGAQRRAARNQAAGRRATSGRRMSKFQLRALLDGLRRTVQSLRWDPKTTWSDYGDTTSYTPDAAAAKRRIVSEMLERAGGSWAWDIGANTGDFSALAAAGGRRVVAVDADPGASDLHFRRLRDEGNDAVLSIVGDLLSPSPALGWGLAERPSLIDRANADVILALALVHHLAIGGNVPLGYIAELFARLAPNAIVEFVPKEDPQVARMLSTRRDVFADYDIDGFRAAVSSRFEVAEETTVPGSVRSLFLLRRRG